MIDKNDLTSEEGVSKTSESKNESSNNDQNETWKPFTPNNKIQDHSNSDNEPNKSGKFMSTLKRIRLGKRQVSEPGPPPRLISQVSLPFKVWIFISAFIFPSSFIDKIEVKLALLSEKKV